MADTEPNKRWQQRFLDDGTATLYVDSDDGELDRAYSKTVGSVARAFGEGAYSVLPGTYDAGRAFARGSGLLGSEELRRFDQEMDVTAAALEQIAKHPRPAVRAAGRALSTLWDPVLLPHVAGRMVAGYFSGLGPLAAMGDTLRAIENGHNLVDAIVYSGFQGRPPPGGLLGIPPQGGGLLGIPPTDTH